MRIAVDVLDIVRDLGDLVRAAMEDRDLVAALAQPVDDERSCRTGAADDQRTRRATGRHWAASLSVPAHQLSPNIVSMFGCPVPAVRPPSTARFAPMTKLASSAARKAMAAAISSGRPNRPIGMAARKAWAMTGVPEVAAASGVSTAPGEIALTR